jgi:hypothetical protein
MQPIKVEKTLEYELSKKSDSKSEYFITQNPPEPLARNSEILETLVNISNISEFQPLSYIRSPCLFCKRYFMIERLQKHQDICEKVHKSSSQNKKKPSNIESAFNTKNKLKHKLKLNYPNSKWQKQHLDLLKKLRFDDYTDEYKDYIKCPYCFRKFGPIQAEKHISACKDIINKPKPPPSKLTILPQLYKKTIDETSKSSSIDSSFSTARVKKSVNGGLTERIEDRSYNDNTGLIEKQKKYFEPRSRSIYRIPNFMCKCGEILPNRAIFCMMCGLCKYN